MGYRVRLGRIPKSAQEKYAVVAELCGRDEGTVRLIWGAGAIYNPTEHVELFELGKYVTYPEHRTPFYRFDVAQHEYEFDILSKEGLKAIINEYRNDVYQHFLMLLRACDDPATVATQGIKAHIQSHVWEWEGQFMEPYYLDQSDDQKDGALVRSWKKEYAIFNLVYIYQHFDWENDYLIISGW